MRALEENIVRFSPQTHDMNDPHGVWNDIRLNADSLALDHSTGVILEERVDSALQMEIAELLRKAVSTIPSDVDPKVVQRIQSQIEEVLDPELDGDGTD